MPEIRRKANEYHFPRQPIPVPKKRVSAACIFDKTLVFDNYSRSEAALIAGMADMVVNGVSTREELICR